MKRMQFLRVSILSIMLTTVALPANLSEYYTIFTSWIKNPLQVGECLPLSTVVCKEIVTFVRHAQKRVSSGCCYLDAGAGTGAVSDEIVKRLRPCDHLDLVEIDPDMCAYLQKRFAKYANVAVHCCSILDFKPTCKYDAILSTLPFNSFGLDFAQQVVQHFKELANPGCITTYVECSIVRYVFKHFYTAHKQKCFKEVQKYFQQLRSKHLKRHEIVYLNFTPIDVYHLEL